MLNKGKVHVVLLSSGDEGTTKSYGCCRDPLKPREVGVSPLDKLCLGTLGPFLFLQNNNLRRPDSVPQCSDSDLSVGRGGGLGPSVCEQEHGDNLPIALLPQGT